MMINSAIFKISGQILDNSKNLINTVAQLTQLYEDHIIEKILIIPGGGSLANFVREIYSEFKINDELAHWIAIYSMNYNGKMLKIKFPHLEIVENFDTFKKKKRMFSILLPYKEFKRTDPLPHSWNVTSDSIALHCAYKLGLEDCFLIKAVDGILDENNHLINELTTSAFKILKSEGSLAKIYNNAPILKQQTKPVDSYLIELIDSYKVNSIILNGVSTDLRIISYFTSSYEERKIFTKIIFKK
ncbi:MAG: hypothetical protein ACFFD5_00345 [Candidatus Thorarchaeota archaeon]